MNEIALFAFIMSVLLSLPFMWVLGLSMLCMHDDLRNKYPNLNSINYIITPIKVFIFEIEILPFNF